ncbi:four helix bundle protein [Fodinibius sp. AD559]
MQRASVSAMTNIAEGFGRYSPKEFIRFLDYMQSHVRKSKVYYT